MITLDHIFLNQNRRHHRDFHLHCVRFQFLMSACIKNTISRDVTLCNVLEIYRRFAKELYCHLQVGRLFVRNGATSHVIITLLLFCYLWFQNNNNNNDDDDDDNNNNRWLWPGKIPAVASGRSRYEITWSCGSTAPLILNLDSRRRWVPSCTLCICNWKVDNLFTLAGKRSTILFGPPAHNRFSLYPALYTG